jgi:hypothetical protein
MPEKFNPLIKSCCTRPDSYREAKNTAPRPYRSGQAPTAPDLTAVTLGVRVIQTKMYVYVRELCPDSSIFRHFVGFMEP